MRDVRPAARRRSRSVAAARRFIDAPADALYIAHEETDTAEEGEDEREVADLGEADRAKLSQIEEYLGGWRGGWNEPDAIKLLGHAGIQVPKKSGRSKHRQMVGRDDRRRNFVVDGGVVYTRISCEWIGDLGDLHRMLRWMAGNNGKRKL